MTKIFATVMFIMIALATFAQSDTSKAIHIRPDQLVWKGVMPPLPAGAKVAVLEGSPKEAGTFTIRFKLPPHWLLPAHWHPADERVTVLSGSVYVGFGEKLDTTKATKFSAGSFYVNPAKSHHYVFTSNEEAIIQITAQGPWGLTYIENSSKMNK